MELKSGIGNAFKMLAVLLAGIVILLYVLFHGAGGISAVVMIFGGTLCLWCLLKPATGIYILAFFCFYLDFVKKLAVVYGIASMNTVIEVLVVQLLALGGVILGTLIRLALFEQRLARRHVIALALSTGVTLVVFLLFVNQGTTQALQAAANNGAYAGMVLVCLACLEDRQKMMRYLDFLFLLAVPWALYGVAQYIWGFPEFEWEYARTGLSPISNAAMLFYDKPRPFGFSSGEGGYSVLMIFQAYGTWRFLSKGSSKVLWGAGTLIILAGSIASMQRTPLILPIEILIVCFVYRRRMATTMLYASGVLVFVTAVILSDWLLAHLSAVDESVTANDEWTQRVVKVSTWSDRLRGWQRLKHANTYTLYGKRWGRSKFDEGLLPGDEDYGHDMITPTLNNFGVAGILVVFGIPLGLLIWSHRRIWAMPKGENRNLAMLLLATIVVYLAQSSVAGSNLGATPINLVVWTLVGCLAATINRRPMEDGAHWSTDPPLAPATMMPRFSQAAPASYPRGGRMPALRKSGIISGTQ